MEARCAAGKNARVLENVWLGQALSYMIGESSRKKMDTFDKFFAAATGHEKSEVITNGDRLQNLKFSKALPHRNQHASRVCSPETAGTLHARQGQKPSPRRLLTFIHSW